MLQSITVKKLSGIVRKLQQKSTSRMELEKLSSLIIIIKVIPWTAESVLAVKNENPYVCSNGFLCSSPSINQCSLVICSSGRRTKMMELIGPSRKALGVFTILLSFIQVTTSGRALLSGKKIKRNSIIFSNFSCMFLNPNNFFQFEFELF